MGECIFCDILAGIVPASRVYRDELVTAFMDIQPVNPGHVLVIPNRHAVGLADLDEAAGAQMFVVAQRVARALRQSGVRCEGVNLFLADGVTAGQEVFHVHLHVFPRFEGDGFGLRFGPHYRERPSRAALEEVAERVRAAL
jgi:histidine triad (HIT) family protein